MEYGTGAIMAVPATTSATSSSRRSTSSPIVRVLAGPGEDADTPLDEAVRRRPTGAGWSTRASSTACRARAGKRAIIRVARAARARARAWCSTGCTTGASRASATGARRSRSSTATTAAPVPVPEKDLPVLLPADRGLPARRHRRLAARAPRGVVLRRPVPSCGKRGPARDRRVRHLPRLGVVLPALPEHRVRRPAVRSGADQEVAARSRRTSAATSTRCCTCCTRASSRWCCTTWATLDFEEPFREVPGPRH